MTEQQSVHRADGGHTDCYAASPPRAAVSVTTGDLAPPAIDVARATDDAVFDTKGGNTTRGQDESKCPTDSLPLHANTTGNDLDVSGDLVIASDSCPVQLSLGGNRAVRFKPGTNVGVTVKVEAGAVMVGQCIPDPERRREKCDWSFTRTSP